MGNPVVHWDLMSQDPARTATFYEKLFGWNVQFKPELDYRLVEPKGGGIGGGITKPDQPAPGNMLFHIEVDDLAAYRRRIVDAGGSILVEEEEVPGIGSFALFADTDGRTMGLWRPKSASGSGAAKAQAAKQDNPAAKESRYDGSTHPVVHFELMSKEPAKVAAFYEKVFGWKVQHRPELNYRIVETGGKGGINGGIVKPQQAGPWPGDTLFYVLVDDLAEYRRKAVAAGGRILIEEQEVPGMGRFALFTDPDGRMTGLWKTTSQVH